MDKIKKKKGPIRLEAIIPITIIIVLFGIYFRLFFDSHLKWGLEYAATQGYGAEVNVGSLNTDFFAPSILINKIEITDKSQPELNIVEIGEVRLALLWDGLLRGKFVVPESSILKVQAKSKRNSPGRIIPPQPNSSGDSAVTKAAEKTIDQLKEKNESNLLSDVFSVAGGTNYQDQLKNMENQLKTQGKIKELEKELKKRQAQWKERINALPDESEIKTLVKKIETLKLDTKNPAAIQASLQKIDQVYKEAQQKYKTIDQAKKSFEADFKKFDGEYKGLERMVQSDINQITEKLNIPSLDPQEINKMLLGNLVAAQLGELLKYKNMANEYMPEKSTKKDDALTPKQRAEGVNYRFPKKKSFPQFWLKKAQISSNSKDGQAGDMEGTVLNLTNNPRHLGLPAEIRFRGGFPKENILNVTGDITIDHTTDEPTEFGRLAVGSFPVPKKTLTESKDVSLGFNQAQGATSIKFKMVNETLTLDSNTALKKVDYFSSAANSKVAQLLSNIIKSLNNLDLNIKASGRWDSLKLNINSNLGQKLQSAIKQEISGEVRKARQKVEAHVRGLVDKEKAKLKNEVAKLEQSLGVSLKSREEAVASVTKKVNEKKNNLTAQEKKKLEDKGKKELKKLLKGIKF